MTVNAGVIGALHPGLDDNQLADMARDTAFDFYLEFLTHNDAWGKAGLVFKGGTAVRKFHCPPRDYHRISYDLDFTLLDTSAQARLPQLMSSAGPYRGFQFGLETGPHTRIRIDAPFLAAPLGVGFDAAHATMLQQPQRLALLRRPIHDHYDIDLSFTVPVMSVDETVAEKLTRWQHRPLIRDLYDLVMLRPLIADTAATAKMWIIKSYQNYHNPDKGPTTSAPQPVDFEGIIDAPDTEALKLRSLQFDTPMADHEKVALVERMLAEFPEAYSFCVDEVDTDLEAWGSDTAGDCRAAVIAAAADMASTSLAYERSLHGHQPLGGGWPSLTSMHDDGHATVPKQKPPPAAPPLASVVCGERLGPRRSCRRTLQTKPCPLHPNSPGSTRIKRSRRS